VISSSNSSYHYDWAELDPEETNNHLDFQKEKYDPDHPPAWPYFDYDHFHNETGELN
jgi:hypothetical protein